VRGLLEGVHTERDQRRQAVERQRKPDNVTRVTVVVYQQDYWVSGHGGSDFSYLGPCAYFLTFCTLDRRPAFRDDEVASLATLQTRRTAREREFALLAYCFMPDHLHVVVEGTSANADLCRFSGC
jgi:hypothetical protein